MPTEKILTKEEYVDRGPEDPGQNPQEDQFLRDGQRKGIGETKKDQCKKRKKKRKFRRPREERYDLHCQVMGDVK